AGLARRLGLLLQRGWLQRERGDRRDALADPGGQVTDLGLELGIVVGQLEFQAELLGPLPGEPGDPGVDRQEGERVVEADSGEFLARADRRSAAAGLVVRAVATGGTAAGREQDCGADAADGGQEGPAGGGAWLTCTHGCS